MRPAESAHLPVYAATDPGRSGKNNEDNYAVSAHVLRESDSTPSLVAIIADGVGGHQAGEIASSMAVEIISQIVADSDASQPLNTLEKAFSQANQAIYSQATIEPANAGMSTTAASAWIIGNRLFLASMGDSRIYLRRDGELVQLTIDHTWVQEAIESGILTLDQARSHPNAHLIRRYLGSKQPAIPDFRVRLGTGESDQQAVANQGLYLQPGDFILLSSDGLTDLVTDDEINVAISNRPLKEALDYLIELANKRGGHDNITLIGIQVPDEKIITTAPKPRKWPLILLIILGVAVLLVAGSWLYQSYFSGIGTPTATIQSVAPLETRLPSPTQTGVPTTQIPETTVPTPPVSPSGSVSEIPPSATQVPATYTPWPTSTTGP